MMYKVLGMADSLSKPDYKQVFQASTPEQRKLDGVHIEAAQKRPDYREISQSVQSPNYEKLFSSKQDGNLIKTHVYEQ